MPTHLGGGSRPQSRLTSIWESHCDCCRTSLHDFYVVGHRINSGLSAEVFEATDKATGGHVALKVYFNSDRTAVHETITEHVCMTRAACDLVLRCHGIVFDGTRPALVLDLAQQSLRNYLQVNTAPTLARTCAGDQNTHASHPRAHSQLRSGQKH